MKKFDASDIDHLVERFTPQELRQESHNAEIQLSVAKNFGTSEEEHFWEEYLKICGLALDVKRSQAPVRTSSFSNSPTIEEAKSKTDIVEVVSRYTRLSKRGNRYIGKCPIHGDSQPSLTVYPDEGKYWCFGCNAGGDALDFIMSMEKVSLPEAINVLTGKGE